MFIPFIGAPLVNAVVAYIATQTGLVSKVISLVPWTAPAPLGAAWGGGWHYSSAILVAVLIVIDFFIYLPFFKVYEKQLIAQENT